MSQWPLESVPEMDSSWSEKEEQAEDILAGNSDGWDRGDGSVLGEASAKDHDDPQGDLLSRLHVCQGRDGVCLLQTVQWDHNVNPNPLLYYLHLFPASEPQLWRNIRGAFGKSISLI
ncbi:unnamed protein product [Pleuronectes platessa]|uniref:Uncharacterized protein n=1 Tax=Pleuronectes platessa TaxID=8262 RepID=A0A9N7ZCD2_PLEPL|nr:unnamed protein product [Pleuronectes platessa]